jgi:cell division protein FtsX
MMTENDPTLSQQETQKFIVWMDLGEKPESTPEATRHERIAIIKSHFEEKSEPVQDAIRKLGVAVLDQAWLNETLLIELSKSQLDANVTEQIESISGVVEVSRSKRLIRE